MISIQQLREEIEHIDTNLVRFNVKKDSDEFIKRIREFNEDNEPLGSINGEETFFLRRCCLLVSNQKFQSNFKLKNLFAILCYFYAQICFKGTA